MELVLGRTGELWPGPYVDCPEEGCAYTLRDETLMRHQRSVALAFQDEAIAVDPEVDVAEHERPRLRRIARMLAMSGYTAKLASPFVVFVPREGDAATDGIRQGSGIVGQPRPGTGHVAVYFEGAVHRQEGMSRFADRVFHAHGGLANRDPTIARMLVSSTSLVEVGIFDPASGLVVVVGAKAEQALAAWLGGEELDQAELLPSASST